MTTRTVREADITITKAPTYYGKDVRYVLSARVPGLTPEMWVEVGSAANYAAALQARADIIDERAGAAQVGDLVRIGLKGQVVHKVYAVREDCTVVLTSRDQDGRLRFRRVDLERVHVVEAAR